MQTPEEGERKFGEGVTGATEGEGAQSMDRWGGRGEEE